MAENKLKWCLFYSDGTSFSHEDGDPQDAPTRGVQCVVQDWLHPCQVLHQSDFYWWRADLSAWFGGDIHGFLDQSAYHGASWVKQGESLQSDLYSDILSAAVALKDKWDVRD